METSPVGDRGSMASVGITGRILKPFESLPQILAGDGSGLLLNSQPVYRSGAEVL